LLAAESTADRSEELGDLLMVLVNVGRRYGIQAEAALRGANDKFRRRFREVERLAADRGVALRDMDFVGLDELWDAAKNIERAGRIEAAEAELAAAAMAQTQSAQAPAAVAQGRSTQGPAPGGAPEETR